MLLAQALRGQAAREAGSWARLEWFRGYKQWRRWKQPGDEYEKVLRSKEKRARRSTVRRALQQFIVDGTESKIKGIRWRRETGREATFERGEDVFDDGRTPWQAKRFSRERRGQSTASRDAHDKAGGDADAEEARDEWEDGGHWTDKSGFGWGREFGGQRPSHAHSEPLGGWSAQDWWRHFHWRQHRVWEEWFRQSGRGTFSEGPFQREEGRQQSSGGGSSNQKRRGGYWQQAQGQAPGEAEHHLRTLGLPSSTVLEEKTLRDAFLQSAKKWHPDLHFGREKADAEDRFKRIQASYEALRRLAGLQ